MLNRLLHWLSAVTLVSAMCIMLYFSYMFIAPYNVVEFKPDSFKTTKSSYYQGEPLVFSIDYKKNIDIPASVIISFSDGIVYQLPITSSKLPVGRHNIHNCTVTVPPNLPPSKYTLQITWIYKVNPFREITYTNSTNKFTVIKDPVTKNKELLEEYNMDRLEEQVEKNTLFLNK